MKTSQVAAGPTARPAAARPTPPATDERQHHQPTSSADQTPTPAADEVGAATRLLADYPGRDSGFLATPTRTLLTHGSRARVPHDDRPLPRRVAETLGERLAAGDAAPLVIGTVPFARTAPATLTVPQTVRSAPPLASDPLIALPAPAAEDREWRVRPVPDTESYGAGVAAATRLIRDGELRKVVLARTLELESATAPDVPAMLGRLAHNDPSGYTFALPGAAGRILVGASPELLVRRDGGRLAANPLAGSTPRGADPAEDVRRAAALLESAKDLHEHALVVAAVREALAPYCRSLTVPDQPTLVRTAAMWHLSTTVGGELADQATTALDLACALHPTPAVCGTPTELAREVIRRTEPFDRGGYTGMVGWQDAAGDGEWVVALRCAEVDGRRLRLYAGAGVVADSAPAAEAAETEAKFGTFLNAVGVRP